ncbi:MAG TPA: hypothetical protein VND65_14870 [Candidatus Binatia bacterium]|nr:hypothetical protein [Candidatus Binatia bacterium]
MLTRRRFLGIAAGTLADARLSAQNQSKTRVALSIPREATGPHMPIDFIGLSYEVQQLADPNFFSAQNSGLIREFKALSSTGVLRLGGNTSEFAYWKATPDSSEPEHPQTREVPGEPKAQYYAVTPDSVKRLAEFLRAAGWTCIYGIGMGTNTPLRAAEEAAFVAETLGDRLQYFLIGNEPDLFDRHLRDPKSWSPKIYFEEWLTLARAVATRVSTAKFGMPDVTNNVSWLTEISDQWSFVQNPLRVTALTHHYYFGGPATNPDVNIPNLLKNATMQRVQNTADVAKAAAGKMGESVRMTEGNTCYRGGKPGVSDVFAAALWSADYSLLLASNGYSGVNLHGGTGKSVANSVGGFLPGDQLLLANGATPEQIASHPHPFYSPIGTFGSDYVLEPVAYGLKFAGAFGGGTLLQGGFSTKLQTSGVNATAYAAKLSDGKTSVIILNKDSVVDLEVELDFGTSGASGAVETETLHAPALQSREAHITMSSKTGSLKQGKYSISVAHATGVRITLG